MAYEERIRHERPKMSKSFAKLADFLLDYYVEAAFMTASELAQALDLDAATVVRFSQHLGYSGFPKMQREIRQRVKEELLIRPHEAKIEDSVAGVVQRSIEDIWLAVEKTQNSLDIEALERLVNQIGNARRIIILPEIAAQPSAYTLLLSLEEGGFPVYVSRTGIADMARIINYINQLDLIIAMEVSGQSVYITRAMALAQDKGIQTAAIIGSASLASARYANTVLSAQAKDSIGMAIVSIDTIVYLLIQVLRWRFSERFTGTEQAITDLVKKIYESVD